MRILFISSSSGSRGGGELYLIFLAEALVAQGIEVALWCSSHQRMDELAGYFSRVGKVYRSAYKNTYDYRLRSLAQVVSKPVNIIRQVCEQFNPDVIHLNKQNIEDGLDLVRTLDQIRIPFVTTIHITQSQKSLGALFGGWRDTASRKVLQKSCSRKWITVSSSRSEDLAEFLRAERGKIMMIPNAVKVNEDRLSKKMARKKLNLSPEDLIIISVGRLESQKDPWTFLEWAFQCVKLKPDIRFYWIGDGALRGDFEKRVANLGLAGFVKCLGWQTDLKPYYASADVYVHTAKFEGLPFSLLEAMSQQLPCVVTEALYSDLGLPEGVIHAGLPQLMKYIEDERFRATTGNKAFQFISGNLSWDTVIRNYINLYQNIK